MYAHSIIPYIDVAPIMQGTHVCYKIVRFKGGHLM